MILKVKVNDIDFQYKMSIQGCMCGANLVIPTQINDELSRGQTEFSRVLSLNGQNHLKGQNQWPPFSIPADSIPRCMFDANLVIVDQICDELLCEQDKVYGRTDGQRDRRRQRQYPFGLKGQGVKTKMCYLIDKVYDAKIHSCLQWKIILRNFTDELVMKKQFSVYEPYILHNWQRYRTS